MPVGLAGGVGESDDELAAAREVFGQVRCLGMEVDADGNKTAVILSLQRSRELMEAMHDLRKIGEDLHRREREHPAKVVDRRRQRPRYHGNVGCGQGSLRAAATRQVFL